MRSGISSAETITQSSKTNPKTIMSNSLLRYELTPATADYLIRAVNALQVRGEDAAADMLNMLAILRNPTNKSEIVSERAEEFKKSGTPAEKKSEETGPQESKK